MAKIETLTAYTLKFSYLQRNNPLIEEQRDAIKAGLPPIYTLNDFIADYHSATENLAIGKNSDRAIKLPLNSKKHGVLPDGTTRIYLSPQAGKQGKPLSVIKMSSQQEHKFGADFVALYDYHMFLYENADTYIAVFHRQNGSGCKSVFLETANNILKPKGLKLEMQLHIPLSKPLSDAVATKITLQYTKSVKSSDIADNYGRNREKTKIVRELGLNLEVLDNNNIVGIIKNMQMGEIDQDVAFAQIKACFPDGEEYNDAEVQVRLGKRTKRIKWNEFEGIFGTYDITEELNCKYKTADEYLVVLTEIADEYYNTIIESGGSNDVE